MTSFKTSVKTTLKIVFKTIIELLLKLVNFFRLHVSFVNLFPTHLKMSPTSFKDVDATWGGGQFWDNRYIF